MVRTTGIRKFSKKTDVTKCYKTEQEVVESNDPTRSEERRLIKRRKRMRLSKWLALPESGNKKTNVSKGYKNKKLWRAMITNVLKGQDT